MIHPAGANRLNRPVLADRVYGAVTTFRRELHSLGREWCLCLDSPPKVIDAGEDFGEIGLEGAIGGRPVRPRKLTERSFESESVAEWAFARQGSVHKVTCRQDSKGPMASLFAVRRVRHPHRTSAGAEPQPAFWLIEEWLSSARRRSSYSLPTPQTTSKKSLDTMVQNRWRVEHSSIELEGRARRNRSHPGPANLGKLGFSRGPIAAKKGGMSLQITEEQISKWPPDAQAVVRFLLAKIADLEKRLQQFEGPKTPQNSSPPPSSQHPHAARPKRPKSKRKRGGQPGHRKYDRALIPTADCDETKTLKPTACRRCGTRLSGSDRASHAGSTTAPLAAERLGTSIAVRHK